MFELKSFKEGIAKVLNIQTAHVQMSEAAAQIESLTTEVETLKASHTEALAKLGTDHGAVLGERVKENTALQTTIGEQKTFIETLTKQLETEKKSVSSKVTKELASIGVPEGTVKEAVSLSADDPSGIMAQIKSLRTKGQHKEADALYTKHRSLFVK
jgi:hypothetical protein